MPIEDVLLPLVGEPDTAAIAAIDKCVAVAGDIGAKVTAMAVEEIPVRPRVTISADLENSAAVKAVRSVSDAHGLLKAFDAAANRFGVRNEQKLDRLAAADIPANFTLHARLKDLALVAVKSHNGQSEGIVDRLIFESGRPVGKVFEAYVRANAIDLLVMGAYRHSRVSEFIWGGATQTVIGRPPCWIMMSY
jgi:nucleotide-binding universal stress UspA family protein